MTTFVAIILILVRAAAIYSGVGWAAAWVLLQFGAHVSWFVCAVAIWLISFIGRSIFGK